MIDFRHWFEEKVDNNYQKTAIYFEDRTISYQELDNQCNRAANFFDDLGIKKGDKVSLLLPNCPEYLYIWFGLAKLGAVSVFLNTSLDWKSLEYLIKSSDSNFLVVNKKLVDVCMPTLEALKSLKWVIWFPSMPSARAGKVKELSYEQLISKSKSSRPRKVALYGGDPMGFVPTGGTTGLPKLCILSHNLYIHIGERFAEVYGLYCDDRIFDPLPLYHINPHYYCVMAGLAAQCSIIMAKRFSASQYWNQVQKYKATVCILHGAPVEYLKKQPKKVEETNHSVRLAFHADAEFLERFNVKRVAGAYGSTEVPLARAQSFCHPLPNKFKKSGRVFSVAGDLNNFDVEVAIFDENDNKVPHDEKGQIVVRPMKPHVIFDGYYGQPEKTLEAFRNLWFHTGDVGMIDRDGVLHYLGRATDSIRVKGEWVDVITLEELIRTHPKVQDCCAVGVPSDLVPTEQDIKVFIEPIGDQTISFEEIIQHCTDKVAKFMLPRYIEVMNQLPRLGGTGKVAKSELKKLAKQG